MSWDYTGALTLLQAHKDSTDMLKRGMIETLVQESPLLEMLPFTTIMGNSIKISVEGTLPTPQFRNVNEGYTRSSGDDTERHFGVAILGGEVFVDNFLLKVVANKRNQKAKQYAKYAKAMSRTFDKTVFDGTGTAKDFQGFNALIDAGLGVEITADTGQAFALDLLDEAVESMRLDRPDVWLGNRRLRRELTTLARSTYSGYSLIDVGTDTFGRKVTVYDGVPWRIIGDDINGNAILDFDEDDAVAGGGNLDTASVYAVKFGADENVSGLQGAGGSLEVYDFGEVEAAPGHLGRVEWYPGLAVWNDKSLVRISRINNPG